MKHQRNIKTSECSHKKIVDITRIYKYKDYCYEGFCKWCDAEMELDFSDDKRPTKWSVKTHKNTK